MNRLNHGATIFEEGWLANDRRLTETALLWCDNFHDQSIWWGEPVGGLAGKTPELPDIALVPYERWLSNDPSFLVGFHASLLDGESPCHTRYSGR